MAQLHLPFVALYKRRPLSNEEILRQLRWSTVDVPLDHQKAWEDAHYLRHEAFSTFSSGNGPPWNAPPRASPYRTIAKYVLHLFWVWKIGPTLQIPQSWLAFSSVNWEQEPLLKLATSDSSESRQKYLNDQSSSQLGNSIKHKQQARQKTVIRCQPGLLQQPRIRMQWEFLKGMRPLSFKWKPQSTARAKRRDIRRHAGFLDYNQRSLNKDIWPQAASSALVYQLETQKEWYVERGRPNLLSERDEPNEVGRMVMNAVATDAFPFQWRQTLSWPLFLTRGVPLPVIDYTCQARCISSIWGKSIRPLLFAAQRKDTSAHSSIELLSLAFQPMMTLFTLYYLDTRASQDEPMPQWMVLFGALYDEEGIEIVAFYPTFCLPNFKLPGDTDNWGWGASSYGVSHDYIGIMSTPPWERGSPLAMLYRIQGHCVHVLDRLKSWDGHQRVSAWLGGNVNSSLA